MRQPRISPWFRIMRLQFYPMTFIAYSLGAAAATARGLGFSIDLYLLGYLFLFLLELCTILANELYDLPTDRINSNASPFNGGSRVLVEGKLHPRQVKKAVVLFFCLAAGSALLLVLKSHSSNRVWVLILLAAGIVMGLGYTVPPVKFCYRGLGELVVGLTHSPYVIVCGFVFQTGPLTDPMPWLLSAPLFFAVLSAITLSGIPDHRADKAVAKRTLSVIFGPKNACFLAIVFAVMALLAVAPFHRFQPEGSQNLLVLIAIPHCSLLVIAIAGLIRSANYDRRINGIMQLALSYIIWFGIIPLSACLRT